MGEETILPNEYVRNCSIGGGGTIVSNTTMFARVITAYSRAHYMRYASVVTVCTTHQIMGDVPNFCCRRTARCVESVAGIATMMPKRLPRIARSDDANYGGGGRRGVGDSVLSLSLKLLLLLLLLPAILLLSSWCGGLVQRTEMAQCWSAGSPVHHPKLSQMNAKHEIPSITTITMTAKTPAVDDPFNHRRLHDSSSSSHSQQRTNVSSYHGGLDLHSHR